MEWKLEGVRGFMEGQREGVSWSGKVSPSTGTRRGAGVQVLQRDAVVGRQAQDGTSRK